MSEKPEPENPNNEEKQEQKAAAEAFMKIGTMFGRCKMPGVGSEGFLEFWDNLFGERKK